MPQVREVGTSIDNIDVIVSSKVLSTQPSNLQSFTTKDMTSSQSITKIVGGVRSFANDEADEVEASAFREKSAVNLHSSPNFETIEPKLPNMAQKSTSNLQR